MTTVIKHGHAQYFMTCSKCECEFTFEDEDIKNNNCQFDYEEWVICPECAHNCTLDGKRSSYKYRPCK